MLCETVGASSMAQSLRKGELVTLPSIDSICGSLGAKTVAKGAFERCKDAADKNLLHTWTFTDADAVRACTTLLNDHRVLAEPACGAGLAAVYQHIPLLQNLDTVVVQVCGGAIVDLPMLYAWQDALDAHETY